MTDEALWFDGVPYTPLDNLDGIVIEESTVREDGLLSEIGFSLDRMH